MSSSSFEMERACMEAVDQRACMEAKDCKEEVARW